MAPIDSTSGPSSPTASPPIDFNFDWRFSLSDDPGFAQSAFDDNAWRCLRLPHDWSVEFPFDKDSGEGATAYLPGGIGWYRKHFTLSECRDAIHFILFDGVYNNAEFWINGTSLGVHPYGYTPALFDLTPHLNPTGMPNVVAVRVDHSRYADSRWYTGSGIYRNVRLIRKPLLHIPVWGVFITTPEVSRANAKVNVETTISNGSARGRDIVLRSVVVDAQGHEAARRETEFTIQPGAEAACRQSVDIPDPHLWHPDRPTLYRALTSIIEDGGVIDVCETSFGIRSLRFDPNKGFFINEINTRVKGVCLHHDAGLVGAAVPAGVWRRRLLKLKELGCNAIRTAHNPASEEFLTLCDELGFLVQEEFFDEWDFPKDKRLNSHERHEDYITRGYTEHFQEWAESDLKTTVLRDRNHPCIFQWSIGNEIEWTYTRYAKATGYFDANASGNYFWTQPPFTADAIKERFNALPKERYVLSETAHRLAAWTRETDTTRPVVSNCILPSVSHVSGYADALDVVGYSYRQVMYDLCHELYPDKVIMGTENLGQWHEWKHVIERPFTCGIFIWVGIHYLGESHEKWPVKGTAAGMIDFAGFEHGAFHIMRALWREDEPMVHVTTQTLAQSLYTLNDEGVVIERTPGGWAQRLWTWPDVNNHWNYEADELVAVEICSNCDEVELFLNGNTLGVKHLADQEDRIFKWAVPFAAGALEAHGRHRTDRTAAHSLITAGEPAAIDLTSDARQIRANAYDVAHVEAQLIDAEGRPVRHVEREIVFSVEGPCRSLGVDNGAADNVQPYQSDRLTTSQGRALLIIQSESASGIATVTAGSGALRGQTLKLGVE